MWASQSIGKELETKRLFQQALKRNNVSLEVGTDTSGEIVTAPMSNLLKQTIKDSIKMCDDNIIFYKSFL